VETAYECYSEANSGRRVYLSAFTTVSQARRDDEDMRPLERSGWFIGDGAV
jgi:hypothetical protein